MFNGDVQQWFIVSNHIYHKTALIWLILSWLTDLCGLRWYQTHWPHRAALAFKDIFQMSSKSEQSPSWWLPSGRRSSVITTPSSPSQFICHHTAVCHGHPEAAGNTHFPVPQKKNSSDRRNKSLRCKQSSLEKLQRFPSTKYDHITARYILGKVETTRTVWNNKVDTQISGDGRQERQVQRWL